MVGGMLEYFSMLFGYHMLLWLVLGFYILAMLLWHLAQGEGIPSSRQVSVE